MPRTVFLLNGPNLNLLGTREPEIYGHETLGDIETMCANRAAEHGLALDFRQSNHEGEIVTWIQEARLAADGLIINPAAYTHTSVAIQDALRMFEGPVIELHLSNTHKREAFRHHSFVSPVATGVIMGFGPRGYALALDAMATLLMEAD